MGNIKVSIIVPIYNVEKYLSQCLGSIENQTLKEIEIICIIDKSPDRCYDICKEHQAKDPRIKIINKDRNEGLGLTRNAGLAVAQGEYVAFCDSDDYLDRKAYDTVYHIAKEKDLDICYFNYKRFYNNGQIKDHTTNHKDMYFMASDKVRKYLLEMIGPFPSEHVNEIFPVSSCMGIFKRERIESNHVRFICERKIASEDIIFHLDLLSCVTKIGRVSSAFYFYRVNNNSISTSYSEKNYYRSLKLMENVKSKLQKMFDYSDYFPHYISFLMTCYRGILRKECCRSDINVLKIKRRLKEIYETPYVAELLSYQNVRDFSIKNQYLLFCMKYKLTMPLIILYKIFYPIIIRIRKV